ncbi:MAG: hypothetical protein AAGG80_04160 [Pseudomonadota bacterium]
MKPANLNFISVGSKTFLLGEYAALEQAPALLACTKPRFYLEIKPKSHRYEPHFAQFDLASPAGKYLAKHYQEFKNYELDFFDPHFGKGGLGASGAQFILVYIAHQCTILGKDPKTIPIDLIKNSYLRHAYRGLGKAPSAYDIYAQTLGNLAFIDPQNKLAQTQKWPFDKLAFLLVRTGIKISTHEHLKFIKNINAEPLEKITRFGYNALSKKNARQFIEAVYQYQIALQEQKFTHEKTLQLLKKIRCNRYVHAVKGCGALGADVLLILCDKEKFEDLTNWLNLDGIKIVASSEQLTAGLMIEKSRQAAV